MQCGFEKAYAKLNLTLDVISKRDDGYHNLEMIMQSVSLCDSVSVRIGCGGGITLVSNLGYIPKDERNIAVKAAMAFFEATGVKNDGVAIVLEKRIPSCAGLAGGSSDGAAVLRLMNRLYGTGLSREELCKIGVKVGADVPFCIVGGTALARGRGEILADIEPLRNVFFVLCKPKRGMSTKSVFEKLCIDDITRRPDTTEVLDAIQRADIRGMASGMCNVLEEIVERECDDIARIKNLLGENGAQKTMMTGSGSTVFGVFDSKRDGEKAFEIMKGYYEATFFATPTGPCEL